MAPWIVAAGASEDVQRHDGIAYRRGSEDVVYRESHWRYREAGQPRRLVLYRWCRRPTVRAQAIVRCRRHGGAGFLTSSTSAMATAKVCGAARTRARCTGSRLQPVREQRESVNLGADAVVDAGFDPFIRTNWTELVEGRPQMATFLLPSDFNFLQLVVRKTSTSGGWADHAVLPARRSLVRVRAAGNHPDLSQ